MLCKITATLPHAIVTFNALLSPRMLLHMTPLFTTCSSENPSLDLQCFRSLLNTSPQANKVRLLSALAPYASELGLHVDPSDFSLAIWWLGVETLGGLPCSDIALDPIGHHASYMYVRG